MDRDAVEGPVKEYSNVSHIFQGVARLNEANLIEKELHIYEYSSIGEPSIVDMTNLKHPITKSGVDKDEDNGRLKEDNEDNYGNKYEVEDNGGEDDDGDDVVIAQHNFLLGKTTEYDEYSIFHYYQAVSNKCTFSTTMVN